MIQQKTLALAQALVFVHGSHAREEVDRQRALFRDTEGVSAKELWEEVAHVLPLEQALKNEFARRVAA
jgi:hypothetical protein